MKAVDVDRVLSEVENERRFILLAKEMFGDKPLFANYQASADVVLKTLDKIEKRIRLIPCYEIAEPDE